MKRINALSQILIFNRLPVLPFFPCRFFFKTSLSLVDFDLMSHWRSVLASLIYITLLANVVFRKFILWFNNIRYNTVGLKSNLVIFVRQNTHRKKTESHYHIFVFSSLKRSFSTFKKKFFKWIFWRWKFVGTKNLLYFLPPFEFFCSLKTNIHISIEIFMSSKHSKHQSRSIFCLLSFYFAFGCVFYITFWSRMSEQNRFVNT